MDFKFLFVLCVTCLLLTSVLSKPLNDGSAEIISEDVTGAPLRFKRTVIGNNLCPNGSPKVANLCPDNPSTPSDY
ncbi:hypothetical protein O3G_MSEX011781 [Manduca sexta]|uniref:Uncharacterized protein n=1 Tax=Manduca sexta TaxID=7130 RepID=A0A921ZM13_MANSE|nr:hypothetical protein O3G_MSEX011781 [Manduca sexta]